MKTFEQFLIEKEFSWWDNMLVPWLLQPHKIPVYLAGAALGAVLGTGVGAYRAVTHLNPLEIPKQMGKWGLGMLTQWKHSATHESTDPNTFPPELQAAADELTDLGHQLQASQNNPEDHQKIKMLLIKKSKEFYDRIQKMSVRKKQDLASNLPSH